MIQHLQTERLHLRKMTTNDAASLFTIWSDPEVTEFMNISNFTTQDQTEEMITFLDQLAQDHKAIRFSIIEKMTGEIIGSCGYNSLDFENEKAEIGYEIARDHWGKGYAPEAISSLIDYAFNTLHFHRIEAKVGPENVNSIKVLDKLGFIHEGTLRQCEKSKDSFIDLNMYSRLKTD
ncbi:ribosomal-protein-alanine N-acetyltransferase [Gracilibacillus orientalis]|uniref:Ribosomal-protein-alanine N-acetyltransferase n=1 Tax=Gracilibacillus orientalis TaxID=334253 RepID=A0A1I4IVQ1_9BACI|nr:GNAT family N-acetyltransferase [Gracilibacillus orientalis]SFL58394.1 ribosomal-protein-alanine N-acetyltransferase [Gracilibacillus orientalis]